MCIAEFDEPIPHLLQRDRAVEVAGVVGIDGDDGQVAQNPVPRPGLGSYALTRRAFLQHGVPNARVLVLHDWRFSVSTSGRLRSPSTRTITPGVLPCVGVAGGSR
ncbi:MAG: hypothetical protein H6816_08670 [Phycisphaerales bacterium]|nr:hypothetical protein [Phycisphaerales bacterium]